ncbi:MAG TPA: hypothetical protein VFR58_12085 [Flavisolibacter sp.]|nr:hypothetical protein [Flavisolibacter sp.]
MRNYILYRAFDPAEIHGCAYALLKYLAAYNLKPPASHAVVIYTSQPAALEVFGSFFNEFELKELSPGGSGSGLQTVRDFACSHEGNLLYMDSATYPVKGLDEVFAGIRQGQVYADAKTIPEGSMGSGLSVLGLKAPAPVQLEKLITAGSKKSTREYIAQYGDFKEFGVLLRNFFNRYQEESIPNLVKLIHPIDAVRIRAQKAAFEQLPFYLRWARKAVGRGWSIGNYIKA